MFAIAELRGSRGVVVAVVDKNPGNRSGLRAPLGERFVTLEAGLSIAFAVGQKVTGIVCQTCRIDFLVNCAGINGPTNIKSHEVDLADFKRVFAINVRASLVTF